MFTSLFNWFKGAIEGFGDFIKFWFDIFKKFFNWIAVITVALIAIFKDVLEFIVDMLGRIITAIGTLINFTVNTNVTNSGDLGFMNFADAFIPLHEAFVFIEAIVALWIAVITIRIVRFIKKTFWAS